MEKAKKQYVVERVFIKEPWKNLTYLEIQKLSKNKSKSYLYSVINRLKEKRMISQTTIGKRTITYCPRLDIPSAQSYWGFLAEYSAWNKNKFPFQIIENLRDRIPTPFFTLMVTGSYAKGTQSSNSDLDVVIISNEDSKLIYSELKYESQTSIPSVHLYVFTKEEFFQMLFSKKENYGKEIVRNNLIFFGGAPYYSILSEAIKNGFKG